MTTIINLTLAFTLFFGVLIVIELLIIGYIDKHEKGDIHEQ